jgi:hypothetical protein
MEAPFRVGRDPAPVAECESLLGRELVERFEEVAVGNQVTMADGNGAVGIPIRGECEYVRKRAVVGGEHVEENQRFETQHDTASSLNDPRERLEPTVEQRRGSVAVD